MKTHDIEMRYCATGAARPPVSFPPLDPLSSLTSRQGARFSAVLVSLDHKLRPGCQAKLVEGPGAMLCHVQLAEGIGLKEADIVCRGQQLVRHQLHDIRKCRAWGKRQLSHRKTRDVKFWGKVSAGCRASKGTPELVRCWANKGVSARPLLIAHNTHTPWRASRREAETQLGKPFPPGAPWVWVPTPPERVQAPALIYGGQLWQFWPLSSRACARSRSRDLDLAVQSRPLPQQQRMPPVPLSLFRPSQRRLAAAVPRVWSPLAGVVAADGRRSVKSEGGSGALAF